MSPPAGAASAAEMINSGRLDAALRDENVAYGVVTAVPRKTNPTAVRPAARSARTYDVMSHSYHPLAVPLIVCVARAVLPRGGRVPHVRDVSAHVVLATGWTGTGTSPFELSPPCRRTTARPTVPLPIEKRRNAWRWLSIAEE